MKTIVQYLVICHCILINASSFAQQLRFTEAEQLAAELKSIQNSPYIFEGMVIKQEEDGGSITRNVISINRIYKGYPEISIGTIQIMTNQSTIENGILIFDGPAGIAPNIRYLFFCNKVTSSIMMPSDTLNTNNSIVMHGYEFIYLQRETDRIIPEIYAFWCNSRSKRTFKTQNDLTAYLNNKGLNVQAEAQPVKK